MADVLVRDHPNDEWRTVFGWQNIHSDKADKIVQHYNKKYDKQYKVDLEEWEK